MNIKKLFKYLSRCECVNSIGPLYLDKEDNLHYFDESVGCKEQDPKLWVKIFDEHSNIVIPLHDCSDGYGSDHHQCIDGVGRPIGCYQDENGFEPLVTHLEDMMVIVIEKRRNKYAYRFGLLDGYDGRWMNFSENDLHPDIQKMAIETIESNS